MKMRAGAQLKAQEARGGAGNRGPDHRRHGVPRHEGDADPGDDGLGAGETVDAVHEVEEVDQRHHPDGGDGHRQNAEVEVEGRGQRQPRHAPGEGGDRDGGGGLQDEAQPDRKPVPVVGQADEGKGSRAAEQQRRGGGNAFAGGQDAGSGADHDRQAASAGRDRHVGGPVGRVIQQLQAGRDADQDRGHGARHEQADRERAERHER